MHEQQCRPATQHQCVEVAGVECTQTEERVRSVFMLIVLTRYTIDVITTTMMTMTRWRQVCGVVEVAECETKVEEVPGVQCRPAMERVCTQIQQVRIF